MTAAWVGGGLVLCVWTLTVVWEQRHYDSFVFQYTHTHKHKHTHILSFSNLIVHVLCHGELRH